MGPQPYISDPDFRGSSRFPQKTFDPKAVTRSSWEVKPAKPKPEGPMLAFNRHPDAHMVLNYRTHEFTSMNPRTKAWVKGLRWFQLVLRLFHIVGAAGVVTLFILLSKVEPTTAWVMRITGGVVMLHGAYAIYHLARSAADRTPGSSAAYSVFAAIIDIATLIIYAFSAYAVHQSSAKWSVILDDKSLVDYFVPAAYYDLIGAGGLHLVSFGISLYLGVVFRKISMMPPDMNPLESHLTARPRHKKNKSSYSTESTEPNEKRQSASQRDSRGSYADLSGPPSIPFMHTRTQSRDSNTSHGSGRVENFAARYESIQGHSPRASQTSMHQQRRSAQQGSPQRGSYAEVPVEDSSIAPPYANEQRNSSPSRMAKFTETWAPTESMISRTNQRNRYDALNKSRQNMREKQPYAAVSQRYNLEDSDDSDYEDAGRHENINYNDNVHPNPLRSNPSSSDVSAALSSSKGPRMQTPFRPLSEEVNASHDLADQGLSPGKTWKRNTLHGDTLYSRPYGELKSATPPIMVGNDRKVSSGNDYDSSQRQTGFFGRRNVSGKVAEEGRAVDRASHYGFFSGR